jgi:hypothetical protein
VTKEFFNSLLQSYIIDLLGHPRCVIGNDQPAVAALFEEDGFEDFELGTWPSFGFALDFQADGGAGKRSP